MEAAEALAAETKVVPTGKLKINAPVCFGMDMLAPKLPEYMQAYPQVEIELRLSNRIVDIIGEGFDAVFRLGELSDSGLIARVLAPYEMVACAAPSYLASHAVIKTPRDLEQHACLVTAQSELRAHWSFDSSEGRVSVPVSVRLMANHDEPLVRAALAGLGVMLQPREGVREALDDGRLVPILDGYQVPSRPLHVLYAPDRRVTPKLRSFLDFAVDAFG